MQLEQEYFVQDKNPVFMIIIEVLGLLKFKYFLFHLEPINYGFPVLQAASLKSRKRVMTYAFV